MNGQFKQWYEALCKRYSVCYDGYEELLQEAFEAGAAKATDEANARANASWTLMCKKMVKAEREACAMECIKKANEWTRLGAWGSNNEFHQCAEAIRART
jgi:hypothetical protein